MSIGPIGSNASQLWQLLKESRTNPSGSTAQAAFAPPPGNGTAAPGGTTTGTSNAAAKVIADVKSLLLSLQDSGTASPGATSPGTSTGAGASGTATASPAPMDVASSLQSLFSDLAKVGGRHGHHGHGGPSPSGQASATGAATTPASSGEQSRNGLFDEIAKMLKAYSASSSTSASQAATSISA